MHRINSANAAPGNQFTNGTPVAPATKATDAASGWLNAVQEELAGAVEASGATLAAGDNAQLIDAVSMLPVVTRGRNFVDNGNMQIAQRGKSRTFPGDVTSQLSNMALDRWGVFYSNGVVTISQQEHQFTSPITSTKYFLQWAQSTAVTPPNAPNLHQRLGSVRILAGQEAVLSYWARCEQNIVISPILTTNFGTGGSPSAGYSIVGDPFDVQLSSTWTKFVQTITFPSLAGRTIGTDPNSDYISLVFRGPNAVAFTVELSQVQLEMGSVPTAFETRSYSEEFERCSQYFWKSHGMEFEPGRGIPQMDNAIQGRMFIETGEPFASGARGLIFDTVRRRLRVPMYRTPKVQWYSPVTGTAARIYVENLAAVPVGSDFVIGSTYGKSKNQTGAPIEVASIPAANKGTVNRILAHVTVDADEN